VDDLPEIHAMRLDDIRDELRQRGIKPSNRRKAELTGLLVAARKKATEVPPPASRAPSAQ
jgi:hypothetical protein